MEYTKTTLTCDKILVGYSIDTNGILYSKFGRPMKPSKNHKGYLIQAFNVNGKMIARSMHQLVAKQFIPNPMNKRTVNHKDGNKTNNMVSNLEWATEKEQMGHARGKSLYSPFEGYPISCMNIVTQEMIQYKSCAEAARVINKKRCSIDNALSGRKKSCGGFVWARGKLSDSGIIEKLEEKLNNKRVKTRRSCKPQHDTDSYHTGVSL